MSNKNKSLKLTKSNKDRPLVSKFVKDLNFIEASFMIIISFIIVELLLKAINSLCYNTFGLKRQSTLHAFVIFFVFAIIFLTFGILFSDILSIIE